MIQGLTPVAVLAFLLVGGCAVTETTVRTLPQAPSPQVTWKGKSMDDVVAAWGDPFEKLPDGEGGTLLIYKEKTIVSVAAPTAPPPPPSPHAEPPSAAAQSSERVAREKAKFWIDREGVVYRYWFAPEVYEKGMNEPPPQTDETDETEEEPPGGL